MEEKFVYSINGTEFYQKKLVMGQIHQLLSLLKEVEWPSEINAISLVGALGDKFSEALAIVLHDPRTSLKDKDIKKLSGEFFELDPEVALQVAEDFFDCTPISLLLEKMGKTMTKIANSLTKETGSTELPSLSQVETSQNETA